MVTTDEILAGYLYKNTVDGGEWAVSVKDQSDDGNSAILQILDRDGLLVHQETVAIRYARAIFGADMEDVAAWEHSAIRAIDHPELRTLPDA